MLPSVCAVLLTANRPDMTKAAIDSFRAQCYENKRLLIWDTGKPASFDLSDLRGGEYFLCDIPLVVGQLRNRANTSASSGEAFAAPDILIHLDSDDYSHPNRIAEQVALLQSSGADCVGYNEMLFWRQAQPHHVHEAVPCSEGNHLVFVRSDNSVVAHYGNDFKPCVANEKPYAGGGEAWLYSQPNPSYALGTSLGYWRKTWERKPFEATSQGEDLRFTSGLKVVAVSSVPALTAPDKPVMVARIHAGNTSKAYDPVVMRAVEKQGGEWKRVPNWDSYCREVFA